MYAIQNAVTGKFLVPKYMGYSGQSDIYSFKESAKPYHFADLTSAETAKTEYTERLVRATKQQTDARVEVYAKKLAAMQAKMAVLEVQPYKDVKDVVAKLENQIRNVAENASLVAYSISQQAVAARKATEKLSQPLKFVKMSISDVE